jgi:hypothetical protein
LALGQSEERVRELYRSVRSTTGRLFDVLIPVVYLQCGAAAAEAVQRRGEQLIDDSDVVACLVSEGADEQLARSLVELCRDAEGLDEIRQKLGIDLPVLNAALRALGSEWTPLLFEDRLRRQFASRLDERRSDLEERVRDAYVDVFDQGEGLEGYRRDLKLDWIGFEASWIETYDSLADKTIDAHLDSRAAEYLAKCGTAADGNLERLRQQNRSDLTRAAPSLRRVVRAWVAKDAARRKLPDCWSGSPEVLARGAVASGILDFRHLYDEQWAQALARAGLWPEGMPHKTDPAGLGLSDEDLTIEEAEERRRRDEELKAKRTIQFGEVSVDGGEPSWFEAVASALKGAFESKKFKQRSGPAQLEAFGPLVGRKRGRGRGGTHKSDPEYLTEEQRVLIGFAGELAAYNYLKLTVRGFTDRCWVSSMGRRYLGLPPMADDDGFDFKVPRTRGAVCYEVKAHTGDPGYIDLERSQMAAAASMASEKRGRWRVLYVSNVRDPDLVTVSELPNPFSEAGKVYFREGQHQAVRLKLRRADAD